jgi:hypothetical protein
MDEEKLKEIMHAQAVYDSNNLAVTNLSGSYSLIHDSLPETIPMQYNSDYERLHAEISPLCLPDQADKVLYKMIDIIKGYDADDTHRHICDLLMQITRKHVGL